MAATLRRGAAQVSMRIAEACGQDSSIDFAGFLRQARGISMDVEYQLLLARDLEFIKPEQHDALQAQVVEVRKMLSGLIKAAV